MELNVFTEQLEKCYNLLAQQFVLIKQLKYLTISDKTNSEDINTIKTSILNLQNQLNTMINDYVSKENLQTALNTMANDYVSKDNFEELVRETPTDVRVVKDQDNKWQLQLEHDSNVLSIDGGLQTALEECGKRLRLYDTSRSNTETQQVGYVKVFPLNKRVEFNKLYYVKYIDEGFGDVIGALLVPGINTFIAAIESDSNRLTLATLGYTKPDNSIYISSGVQMYVDDADRVEIYEII